MNLVFTEHLIQRGEFMAKPLRVVDIGALGGPDDIWDAYGKALHLIGFEPDEKECERLNSLWDGTKSGIGGQRVFYPFALDKGKGYRKFYVSVKPGRSSFYMPNPKLLNLYTGRFDPKTGHRVLLDGSKWEVSHETLVPTVALDSWAEDTGTDYVDFMKIDVEGAELDVFQGAERLLSTSVLGLWIEVQFSPRFQTTPLFYEVHSYLDRLGFLLFDITPQTRVWHSKGIPPGRSVPGRGQLLDANALYFRNLLGEIDLVRNRNCAGYRTMLLKQASLAEVYNQSDFAIELIYAGMENGLLTKEEMHTMINLLAPKDSKDLYPGGLGTLARKMVPISLRLSLRRLLSRL
ncbi:MAG: FkbM family methyltransferase [Desulfobacteraceae bacterium]|nr:FkbM family methyltransferase [Desulfobacteraceae bacterium]